MATTKGPRQQDCRGFCC